MPEMKSSDCLAESQSLKIKEVINSRNGALAKVYGVYYKVTGSVLGYVTYYTQWKTYAFKPEPGTVWNTEGLDLVSEFIKNTAGGVKK